MESATQPETTAKAAGNGTAKASATAKQTFEVHRPVDGSVIREVAIDSPADVAATVSRVRANQPAWEAIGFAGRYLYADFCGGVLRSFDPSNPGQSDAATGLTLDQPSSFGEGAGGRIYVTSLTGGVFRIAQR